jgi:hypothetical protein
MGDAWGPSKKVMFFLESKTTSLFHMGVGKNIKHIICGYVI